MASRSSSPRASRRSQRQDGPRSARSPSRRGCAATSRIVAVGGAGRDGTSFSSQRTEIPRSSVPVFSLARSRPGDVRTKLRHDFTTALLQGGHRTLIARREEPVRRTRRRGPPGHCAPGRRGDKVRGDLARGHCATSRRSSRSRRPRPVRARDLTRAIICDRFLSLRCAATGRHTSGPRRVCQRARETYGDIGRAEAKRRNGAQPHGMLRRNANVIFGSTEYEAAVGRCATPLRRVFLFFLFFCASHLFAGRRSSRADPRRWCSPVGSPP